MQEDEMMTPQFTTLAALTLSPWLGVPQECLVNMPGEPGPWNA